MLRKLLACSLVLGLYSGALNAQSHPLPGQFELSGSYLYLLPSVDDTYFVITPESSSSLDKVRQNNDFTFQPGWRATGALGVNPGQDIQLSYTQFSTQTKRTVVGENLWACTGGSSLIELFQNYSGEALSTLKLSYQRADALLAQQAYTFGSGELYLNFGLEYASLKLYETHEYSVPAVERARLYQSSSLQGIGPQLGVDISFELMRESYLFPGKLSLRACTSGSLLTCRQNGKESQQYDDMQNVGSASFMNLSNRESWRVVPALHANIALHLDICSSVGLAAIEVGYEMNSYARGVMRTGHPCDIVDSLSVSNYYNFDVQGAYVSASLSF